MGIHDLHHYSLTSYLWPSMVWYIMSQIYSFMTISSGSQKFNWLNYSLNCILIGLYVILVYKQGKRLFRSHVPRERLPITM